MQCPSCGHYPPDGSKLCPACGSTLPQESVAKKTFDVKTLIIMTLSVACLGFAIAFGITFSTLKTTSSMLETTNDELSYYKHNAVFVSSSGDSYYHTYDCEHFDSNGNFYIYNVNLAEYKDYLPCPYCRGD